MSDVQLRCMEYFQGKLAELEGFSEVEGAMDAVRNMALIDPPLDARLEKGLEVMRQAAAAGDYERFKECADLYVNLWRQYILKTLSRGARDSESPERAEPCPRPPHNVKGELEEPEKDAMPTPAMHHVQLEL